ncbi:MAG: thioredoxin family protein [Thiobacillaceae bacterium]
MCKAEHPHPVFEALREGDYHARLAVTHGTCIVLFSNAHCGACRIWKHLLPSALSGQIAHFFEIDVGTATGIARYFGIFHLPTLYLYRDGHFHAELQAEAQATAVQNAVRNLIAAPAQEEP